MDVGIDVSELGDLAGMLSRAAERPRAERAAALDKVAHQVQSEATAIASTYTKGTGKLAESIELSGTPLSRRIFANVREAFFLEFGSPNTGPPRPWLTGPAEKGAKELFDELGKIVQIW